MEDIKELNKEAVILRLNREVDTSNASVILKSIKELIRREKRFIFIDFKNAKFINSATLQVLSDGAKMLKVYNGKLGLISLPGGIRRFLENTNFIEGVKTYLNEDRVIDEFCISKK